MKRWLRKVTQDQDEIEVLETIGHSFQMGDFDVSESDDEERWVGKVDDAVGGWKNLNVGTEWNTRESQFTHWNVYCDTSFRLEKRNGKI